MQGVTNALAPLRAQAQQQQQMDPDHLRTLMMLLQGADALNTADYMRRPYSHETDPLMRPFAVAGNPVPMLGAFGLEDLLMHMLGPKTRKAAELSQILMNAGGLLKTQRSVDQDAAAGRP